MTSAPLWIPDQVRDDEYWRRSMDEEEALARLIALAGTSAPDAALLRAVVEEASELGARRALARLGLADEAARDDIGDLRQLLGAWRDAKKSVWAAVVDWAVRGMLALLVVGLAMKLGFAGLLK
jgi:hypothetical protein